MLPQMAPMRHMSESMHVHIVAVAGTGMGSLAGLLKELGHDVSGSDVAFHPPMGPALKRWGVRCVKGFEARHLEPPPDLVIVGNVCRSNNPEARAAIDGGMEFTHIAGALQRFALDGASPLVVAGTHGKTTTSSLATWLLERVGLEPGFLIGGIPLGFPRSFRPAALGKRSLAAQRRPPFVIEGDEYDTAFFEKTAKMLHYQADVAILTSIEHDHIDIYPTLDDYLTPFRELVAQLPETGLLVANAADPLILEIARDNARCPIAWYALGGDELPSGVTPHWLAEPAQAATQGTTFDLYAGGVLSGRYALPMSGRHNLGNAVGAIAAVSQGYGPDPRRVAQALADFPGIKRRQELLGEPDGVAVYDDFAHHPTAVRETLRALRTRRPEGRLFAVYEPRSATACRKLHQAAYVEAFDSADRVLLAPLGRQLAADEALDVAQLSRELGERGVTASAFGDHDELLTELLEETTPGDAVALLSNGDFGGLHQRLLTALEQRRALS